MLNFIYYPVSAILWFWHKVFGMVLDPASGVAWALSVVFLVFTLRAVLYKPFVKQVRTQRQMQEYQPQIKALQKKHAGDRQRLALEMQKLQKENGFNPIAGCLPVLAQAPVFIGLFHVLRSFNRTGNGIGQLGLSIEENANTANYVFSAEDVRSFLGARLFGAPLSSSITSTADQLAAFGDAISKPAIIAVAVPMMLIASVATHFTARASIARQSPAAAANPQSAIMNKLVLWIFPLGVLVGGPFLPVAILLYWLANNAWTLVQQHYVYAAIGREDEEKQEQAQQRRANSAPKPGARPDKLKKNKPTTSLTKDETPAKDETASPAEPGEAADDGSGASPQTPPDLTKRDAGAPKGGRSPASRGSGGSSRTRAVGAGSGAAGKSGSGARPRNTPARGSRKKR